MHGAYRSVWTELLATPFRQGWLDAGGIKFDMPYRDVPAIGLKIAFITDPVGTYIELTQGLAGK